MQPTDTVFFSTFTAMPRYTGGPETGMGKAIGGAAIIAGLAITYGLSLFVLASLLHILTGGATPVTTAPFAACVGLLSGAAVFFISNAINTQNARWFAALNRREIERVAVESVIAFCKSPNPLIAPPNMDRPSKWSFEWRCDGANLTCTRAIIATADTNGDEPTVETFSIRDINLSIPLNVAIPGWTAFNQKGIERVRLQANVCIPAMTSHGRLALAKAALP